MSFYARRATRPEPMRRADITDVTCAVVAMALRGAPALYLLLSCPVLSCFCSFGTLVHGPWTVDRGTSTRVADAVARSARRQAPFAHGDT
ncbi:hypothetical protein IFJ82_04370 [Novacetimonas hansenii]|uniref:hypothetical protein n=1 Tax=Novacetimonas hansenii TaxID=436 RepID=UPI00177BC8C1|nr:hypothetical protein [Novacetimonas hansenii]MBL7237612.1 hypothetical protein [Novacetimonas hansenii]QOF95870.1 hypothetical protein IFJ82_04370 [Novacetimonas hansenii]